jgi:hypothetical protein
MQQAALLTINRMPMQQANYKGQCGPAAVLNRGINKPPKVVALALKYGKELLLFCSVGALCGAAICFFMVLHLGPFKTPEDAGYATGLFVKSRVQLGFTVWMVHLVILGLRRWFFASPKVEQGE